MGKKALILLAEGFEEVEAITPIDYLRRAGIEVTLAAVGASGTVPDRVVKGVRGISVCADTTLVEWLGSGQDFPDALILPGGLPGAEALAASAETMGMILGTIAAGNVSTGKWICAICAAPAVVLGELGLLAGKEFTCYPGMEEKVAGGKWKEDRVVVSVNPGGGGFITSRSAGCAGIFSTAIIEQLLDKEQADKVARAVLLNE